ncbi:MAG: hypothetical protein Q9187_002552 [Circinaria calcarea]
MSIQFNNAQGSLPASQASHPTLVTNQTTQVVNSFPYDRLPVEVRVMILKEILGNRVIHIARRSDLCNRYLEHDCWTHNAQDESRSFNTSWGMIPSLRLFHPIPDTSILKTCREISSEGSRILWSTCTFAFSIPKLFSQFMKVTDSTERNSIRHLRLVLTEYTPRPVRSEPMTWNRVLSTEAIKSLGSLQTVKVIMCVRNWGSVLSHMEFQDTFVEGLTRFSTINLQRIEVSVEASPGFNIQTPGFVSPTIVWPKRQRVEYAQIIKDSMTWKEEQLEATSSTTRGVAP